MAETPTLDEAVEFAENPEKRCACVLLLDTSGSMQGAPIAALNDGLRAFEQDARRDPLASRRVEIAIVTFDSDVKVKQDFVTMNDFRTPVLTAQGATHMGRGIQKALEMIESRKARYRANDIPYYRPWVLLITDGEPQGEGADIVAAAAKRLHEDEANRRVIFFAVGVEGANMARLAQLVVRPPKSLRGLAFVELFLWLSQSTQAVAHSDVADEQVADEQGEQPPPAWANT